MLFFFLNKATSHLLFPLASVEGLWKFHTTFGWPLAILFRFPSLPGLANLLPLPPFFMVFLAMI